MEAAKAAWQVTAGVLPGDPLKRYELTLGYTSSDLEADEKTAAKNDALTKAAAAAAPAESEAWSEERIRALAGVSDTIFMKCCVLALAHAREVMDPRRVNWVRVDFIWY